MVRRGRERRGVVLVLALIMLFLLSIFGLAFQRLTTSLRRSTRISWQRFYATTSLENAIGEARSIFLRRTNEAPVTGADAEVRKASFKATRRDEVTARNRAEFRRFMRRNRRSFGQSGELVEDEEFFEPASSLDSAPPDEWYVRFREEPERFDVEVPAEVSARLSRLFSNSVHFAPVHAVVLSREADGTGTLAFRATVASRGAADFARSMEKRYRYRLEEQRPPKFTPTGEPIMGG